MIKINSSVKKCVFSKKLLKLTQDESFSHFQFRRVTKLQTRERRKIYLRLNFMELVGGKFIQKAEKISKIKK